MAFRLAEAVYTQHRLSSKKPRSPPTLSSTIEPPAYESIVNEHHEKKSADSSALALLAETAITVSSASAHPTTESLAILPQYISPAPQTIVITQDIFSIPSNAYHITSSTSNTPLFTVSATLLSLTQRTLIRDATTNAPLLTIRKDLFTFPACYHLEDPITSNHVVDITGGFCLPPATSNAEAHFTSATTGQQETLAIQGNWFNRRVQITDRRTGNVAARVERDFMNARQLVGKRHTYRVEIAAGVDVALIVALCICMDERRRAEDGHRN